MRAIIINDIRQLEKIIDNYNYVIVGNGRNIRALSSWIKLNIKKGQVENKKNIIITVSDLQNNVNDIKETEKDLYIVPDQVVDLCIIESEQKFIDSGVLKKSKLICRENHNRYYSDDTSTIRINEFTSLANCYLAAWDNADITIGNSTYLNNIRIEAENNSKIIIGSGVHISAGTQIIARNGSTIHLEKYTDIREETLISSLNNSEIHLGANVLLNKNNDVVAKDKAKIIIGNMTSFGKDDRIATKSGSVIIGEECLISYDVAFDVNHDIYDNEMHTFIQDKGHTEIGHHVWIGKGSFILSESNIGDCAAVGAMSFVNGVLPADSLSLGTPAKVVKENFKWRK